MNHDAERVKHRAAGVRRRGGRSAAAGGAAFLVAAGSSIIAFGGDASADTSVGKVSAVCRIGLFENENLGGREADVPGVALGPPLTVSLGPDGNLQPTSAILDIDVGSTGIAPSSLRTTCDLSNQADRTVLIAVSVGRLAQPPAGSAPPPGQACGAGKGSIDDYTETPVVAGNTLSATVYENSLPRDFPACNDDLGRVSLKLAVVAA